MALTRDFKDTIKARVKRDPRFRAALIAEVRAVRDTKLKRMLLSYLRHPEVRGAKRRASKGDGP